MSQQWDVAVGIPLANDYNYDYRTTNEVCAVALRRGGNPGSLKRFQTCVQLRRNDVSITTRWTADAHYGRLHVHDRSDAAFVLNLIARSLEDTLGPARRELAGRVLVWPGDPTTEFSDAVCRGKPPHLVSPPGPTYFDTHDCECEGCRARRGIAIDIYGELENAIAEAHTLYNADSDLSEALRCRGTGWAEARGWLYDHKARFE